MKSFRIRAYIYLIIVAVIWGASGPVIKFTLGGIDPLPFLAYRFTISAAIALPILVIKNSSFSYLKNSFPLIFLYGVLAVPIALGALFTGIDKSTALDATLIGILGPLVITAGGAVFFRDHITKKEKIGIMIVFIGAAINAFSPIFLDTKSARFTGNIYLLIFLFADAGSILIAKYAVRSKVKSYLLTNFAFVIGALTLAPIVIYSRGLTALTNEIIHLPLKYHLGVWYMALLSGSLAYFLYVKGQKSIEVSEATLFTYLQPVFAVPLAVFWLGENFTPSFIIGAAIIALGLVIAEYKKKNQKLKIKS